MRFLFVDRVLDASSSVSVRGIKHITQDDYYLCQDVHDDRLCFIPSLMGETLGQLAAWYVMKTQDFQRRPVAGVVSSARVHRPAFVGETLLLEAVIDHLDDAAVEYHGVVRVGDEVVFTLEGALGPLLPMSDFIDQELVRRQWQELDRPGEMPTAPPYLDHPPPKTIAHCAPMVFDHILLDEPGVRLCAQKKMTRAAPYFPDHFPLKPVLPLTVLLECQLNLARAWILRSGFSSSYSVYELRKIKMNTFVYPGDVVTCSVSIKRHTAEELVLACRCEVDGQRVCVLEIVFKVLL